MNFDIKHRKKYNMSINMEKIKHIKYKYGNEFIELKNKWGFTFQRLLTTKDVIRALIDIKNSEIIEIKTKIEKVTNLKELEKLDYLLQDSFEEMKSYSWILHNFEEYKRIK